MSIIEPSALLQQDDALLLDVRTPAEFRHFHVKGALNIPLDLLSKERILQAGARLDGRIHVLCRSGARAEKAYSALKRDGFTSVAWVRGGSVACQECGVPMEVEGCRTISLERQVRITAGILVLLGVLLSYLFGLLFLLLTGFVGCGLLFAGVTDWCGLGMILSRMPWNR